MRKHKQLNRLSRPGKDEIKAENLIYFLSTPDRGEADFRVMEVMRMFRELKAKPRLNHSINAHLEELPFVAFLSSDGAIHWRPGLPYVKNAPAPLTAKELRKIPPAGAIKIILEMYEAGTLDRIRQCVCGKWF